MSDMDVTDQDGGEMADSNFPTWAKCSVCGQRAIGDDVRLMPCLHLVCSMACLKKVTVTKHGSVIKKDVTCKDCGKIHPASDVKSSAYILECQERERDAENLKKLNNPKCSYCIRDHNAVAWCGICNEYMCESCKDHHGFAKKTRDHEIETVEQKTCAATVGTDSSNTKCILHGTQLTHFCASCVAIVCDLCCTKRHVGHATDSLKDMATETRVIIQKSLNKIRGMLPTYEQMEGILANKAEQMVKTQYSFLVTEASAQLTRLLSALMKREMEQRKELSETVVHKARELNLKKLKIKSLIAQTQHFLDVSEDLLKDGSDWAIVSNRQLIEAQLFSLLGTADQFGKTGNIEAYTEKGFNFVMDKSVGHQAERHINLTAKITYSFNPKAPTEIKMRSAEMQNRNLQGAGTSTSSSVTNKPKSMAQNPSANAVHKSYAKPQKNEIPVPVEAAGSSSKQAKTRQKFRPGSLAEFMAANKGISNVVDQYANLTDQLIIEPIDEDSEIEDDVEHKSDGDETDVVQDNNDEQDKSYDTKLRSKRGRSRTKVRQSAPAKKQSANKVKKMGRQSTAISGSDSEEGCRNAPNLSPEPMKTPPKLSRVAESIKSEPFGGEDGENPNDAPPPVLVPSVNIPDRGTASNLGEHTTEEDLRNQSSSNNLQEPELETSTRRSRRKSGVYTNNLEDDFEISGPSTAPRRRDSGASEIDDQPGTSTRRGRSRSRSRAEVVPEPVAELPSKRERKKKSDPQFVESTVVYKKRSRSIPKESLTPPSPNTSTSSPSESKRGRPSRGRGRGRRRNRSGGRSRKSGAHSDMEDDCN